MQMLVEHIETTLQARKDCFVRPQELQRVWPEIPDEQREGIVRDFARQHGWRIFTYSRALCSMFVRESRAP